MKCVAPSQSCEKSDFWYFAIYFLKVERTGNPNYACMTFFKKEIVTLFRLPQSRHGYRQYFFTAILLEHFIAIYDSPNGDKVRNFKTFHLTNFLLQKNVKNTFFWVLFFQATPKYQCWLLYNA